MSSDLDTSEQLLSEVRTLVGTGGPVVQGRDPVNQPMIRHMVEALGDRNPVYIDRAAAEAAGFESIVAPPTMLQTWSLPGLVGPSGTPSSPATAGRAAVLARLDAAGFTSVVATNSEQEYRRYLTIGDEVAVTEVVELISDRKQTSLGLGHFVTTRYDYHDQRRHLVASHVLRSLKFAPGTGRPRTSRSTAAGPTAATAERGHTDVGDELPRQVLPITRTHIIATAIASRDFNAVHHDPVLARARGSQDIFMNILTSNGHVGRFITDWGGPATRLRRVSIRLGAPNHPDDTMEMTGQVVAGRGDDATVAVVGTNHLGDHVVATVELTLGRRPRRRG